MVAAANKAGADGEFTVDLIASLITGPGGFRLPFHIPPTDRSALLEGLDEIGMTLLEYQAIDAYEARERVQRPWLQALRKPT